MADLLCFGAKKGWRSQKGGKHVKKVYPRRLPLKKCTKKKKFGGFPFFFPKHKKRESLQKRWEIKTLGRATSCGRVVAERKGETETLAAMKRTIVEIRGNDLLRIKLEGVGLPQSETINWSA